MGQPYVGEIRLVGFNFAPVDWAFCDGSLRSIAENEVLFNLIGTTYGGDGVHTFALPDLRGRTPIHVGNSYVQGEIGGNEEITLTGQQIPLHSHQMEVSNALADHGSPSGNFVSGAPLGVGNTFSAASDSLMPGGTVAASGGNLPHENQQPYLTANYIISLFGVFPSQ